MSIVLCQCGQRIDKDNDIYTVIGNDFICTICLEIEEVEDD